MKHVTILLLLLTLAACDDTRDMQATALFTECSEAIGPDMGPRYTRQKCSEIVQAMNGGWR